MPIFESVENEFGTFITLTDDQGKVWSVPCDESNSDYQAYLAYLAEQETA